MSVTPPPHDPSPSPKRKTTGFLVGITSALVVFGLGNLLLGSPRQPVSLPAAPPLGGRAGISPPSTPPVIASPVGADGSLLDARPTPDGAVDAHASSIDAAAAGNPDGGDKSAGLEGGPGKPQATGTTEGAGRSVDKTDEGARTGEEVPAAHASGGGDCSAPEKDIAREAWRRNLPTICVAGEGKAAKASLYLPLKGNVGESTYDYRRKQRLVRITSPNASSQLTMVQYKVRREGFRDLKLSTEGSGVKFRLTLEKGAGDPAIELKETYIKVVISPPTSGAE